MNNGIDIIDAIKLTANYGEPLTLRQEECQILYDEIRKVLNSEKSIIKSRDKWKADAEQLAIKWVDGNDISPDEWCMYCGEDAVANKDRTQWECNHTPDCPAIPHQLLIEEEK